MTLNSCLSSVPVVFRKLVPACGCFLVLTALVACNSIDEPGTDGDFVRDAGNVTVAGNDAVADNVMLGEVVEEVVTELATSPPAEGLPPVVIQPVPQEPESPEPEPEPEPEPQVYGPASVGDITDLILVTGQSNTLGAGTAYDRILDAPNNRVMAFTDNGWQVADLYQVWDLGWFPRNDPNTDPSNNFSLHFGKQLVERHPDRVTGIILVSAPGEAISHWDEGGEFFEEIRTKVSRAINELPYKSYVSAILWHQGESDGEDKDEYSIALYDLIQRFRSEPWFGYGFPFICGETATSPVNQQLRKLNTDGDPWTACVAAEGLPTVGDAAHFSAPSLRTIGKRYADAYIDMMLGD